MSECSPQSVGGSPCRRADFKRERDEDAENLGAMPRPRSARMETTPCRTPVQSPNIYGTARMCLTTPLCSTPVSSMCLVQRSELGLRWGSAYSPGPRSTQEDRFVCKADEGCCSPHAYFGVFDGHGGDAVAEHCAEHLHANIVNSSHFPDMQQALQDGFLRTDADFLQQAISSQRNKDSLVGSAAVVMLATGQQLILAHAGDCRAVLVRREGAASSFEVLTSDHSAEESAPGAGLLRPDEAERIKRVGQRGAQPPAAEVANGFVNVGDRTVPMTRAFGNMNLKVAQGRDLGSTSVQEQVVTALPEVSTRQRSADDLCIVLASDGLFGSSLDPLMSSEEVANLARRALDECRGPDAEKKAAQRLVDCAIKQRNGGDNTTVVVVALDPPCVPPRDSLGPVEIEHVESQQSMASTASAPSPKPWFGDKLQQPFFQAYPPRRLSEHLPSKNLLQQPQPSNFSSPY